MIRSVRRHFVGDEEERVGDEDKVLCCLNFPN